MANTIRPRPLSWESLKKGILLLARPLRGGGGKGRTTKLEGGGGLGP